ncbi:MAG: hypothetical protein HY919_06290 [Elusimicrobia bacterium]|nr:hypothetical protein [Elusimicrobiota bacterium]
MKHQIEQLLGSSDFIFYHIPIIITTASLFRLKNDVTISAIYRSKELSEIAEECDCLVLKNRRSLDLENYNNSIFNNFIEEYGVERLNKQLNSFNKDVRFVFSVIAEHYCPQTIVVIKHTSDNMALSRLIDYISELFNPSKELLDRIETQRRRISSKLEKKSQK